MPTTKTVTIHGRHVEVTVGDKPEDAQLVIDGKNIPLVYHDGFKGWGVEHTTYGFFQNLEKLAAHMVVSNPELIIGHEGMHDSTHR